MKTLSTIVGLFLTANASQLLEISDAVPQRETPVLFQETKNRFGNKVMHTKHDLVAGQFEKQITLGGDSNHYYFDYEQQAAHLNDLTKALKGEKKFGSPELEHNCHARMDPKHFPVDPHATFAFAPVFTGQIIPSKPKISFEGNCFEETSFELQYSDANPYEYNVVATLAKPRDLTCTDAYLFGNTETLHFETFATHGTHTLKFKATGKDAIEDLKAVGLETYLFCESMQDELLSVITTLKAFVGGLGMHGKAPLFDPHVPEYMEKANLDFLKWAIKEDFVERKIKKVEIDESLIQSGDYFAVMRLDGLDPIIMYGTGSHSGHSVVALRMDGELYIVESQDAWYWPTHRIQRTPFKTWMQHAENCDFHVVHMPLSDEYRAKFDEKKAIEWFYQVEGLPYGYHNFLYGWIDTPEDNWPELLPKDFIPIAFAMIEKFDKNLTDIFFTSSLNFKLGTKNLNITEVADEAALRGLNISDVMAIVEQDGWNYTGEYHDGESMVCSSFVVGLWKAGGLFGDLPINAVEWGPKDVYQVDFFNKNPTRPQQCIDADPNQPWCQLLGKYRMTFPGFSTIKPYAHMNDKCPSIAPDFVRPDGC